MFGSLDASNFSGSVSFYDNEFEKILSKITTCYQLMKTDKVVLKNDENKIRDILLLNYNYSYFSLLYNFYFNTYIIFLKKLL